MNGDRPDLARRTLLAALGASALALAGCGDAMTSGRYKMLTNVVLRRGERRELARDDVAKYSAASIAIQVGGSAQGLVLLKRIEGRDLIWESSDRILLATRGGRIIQTGGFPLNLGRTTLLTSDPVDGGLLTADGVKCTRALDFDDDYGLGIEARSEFDVDRTETLTILGARIPTVRVIERVYVTSFQWRHKNTYWAHATTGVVWKSRQHIHPEYRAITLTTMRPAVQ